MLVETSRGCPYTCDFCVAPIHQGHKFRERSAKALVDEIERSYRELGVEFFYLWGDTVTLNVKSFTAFCDELIARNLPIQWFGNARADNLTDPAFVHRLKRAGCWMLALGIESESEEIRKDMVKRLEREKIQAAFKNMREAGIKSFAFFIFGYPGETPQTMDQTTRYAIELDPDFANFYPAVPYPGTALYEKCVRDGLLQPEDCRLVEDGVPVLPAARQRSRRAHRDGRDQPREAPLLPAPGLHAAARRRRRKAGADEADHRLAGALQDACSAPRVVDTQPATRCAPARHDDYAEIFRSRYADRSGALRRPGPLEAPQIPQLREVAERFLQVHLALARSSIRKDVGHLDDRCRAGRGRAAPGRS